MSAPLITPRSKNSVKIGRGEPFNLYDISGLLNPQCEMPHFSNDRTIRLATAHELRMWRSSLMTDTDKPSILLASLRSSAKAQEAEWSLVRRELIKMLKRNGPRDDHWTVSEYTQ